VAVEAISATVRAGIALGWRVPAGAVDFTNARTTWLADDPEHDWPTRTHMSGFAYERFAPLDTREGHGVWDADQRARWLARLEPYDPRPWEHLARVLHTHGDHRGAERVLIAQRRAARRHAGPGLATTWDWLADVTVRYGFRPNRAAFAIVLLILAVAVSLVLPAGHSTMRTTDAKGVIYMPDGTAGRRACAAGQVRCFDPWWYAIDTVVPIIDLHQRSTWYPESTAMDAWLSVSTVLGWVLSTVFALSFTRLGRSP
jgi:hypothetical protein